MQQALSVGLALAVLWFIEKLLGTPMVIRPIVVSPLVGLLLGDLHNGLVIGASLELVFIGAMQIGAAVPPDVLVGAGLGTAFAIMSNQGPEVALTLALPIAILAQSLKIIVFIMRSWFMDFAVKLAKQGNIKGLHALNLGGLLLQCFMYFMVAFVAILFGSDAVSSFIATVPPAIMNGLTVAGGLLPAVGFALILQPMMTKKNFLYFLFGFALIAYLGLPIMAVTVFGIVLAFLVVFETSGKNTIALSGASASKEEGLFDD